jgi:threonine dehydrogenase-like Zn-dependent dehydrogenase
MTPDMLTSIAGILLSLFFSYIPGLNTWYAAQSEQKKKLLMLALIFLAGAGTFGMACAGWLDFLSAAGLVVACTREDAIAIARAIVMAAVANQTTYLLTPKTKAVEKVKEIKAGAASLEMGEN